MVSQRSRLLPPHWCGCLPFSAQPRSRTVDRPRWTCVFWVLAISWPALSSHDGGEKPSLWAEVGRACPLHCCQTKSLTRRVVLLFKRTTHFSRKEQLLPAPVVLLSWPLLCADSRADFVRGCSHAERGEQEELSGAAGLCLLLLWLWFNHGRAAFLPQHIVRGKETSSLPLR